MKKRFSLFLVLLLGVSLFLLVSCLGPGLISTISDPTENIVIYRALLIGIENYDSGNDLSWTFDDIEDMETVMNNQEYSYQVQRMGDSQRVTKSQILAKLDEYASDTTIDSNDVFFFGYSGHGEYSSETSHLVTSDSNRVSVEEIRSKLDNIPGTKIVSIDACQSGDFVNLSESRTEGLTKQIQKQVFLDEVIDSFRTKEGARGNFETEYEYYVMAAAAIDESGWEFYKLQNGVYSFFFADGVGHTGWSNPTGKFNSTYNADLNNDNLITLSELHVYINTWVNFYLNYISDEPLFQTVQVYPVDSDYVLFKYSHGTGAISSTLNESCSESVSTTTFSNNSLLLSND